MKKSYERSSTPPSLLIAAHCSTIRRKSERLDAKELSAIFDDLIRELNTTNLHLTTYLNSLNEIVKILNLTEPPILPTICSHYFFILIRNIIRNFLQKLCQFKHLNDQEIYVLRNCILLIHHLIEEVSDVSKILHWITDVTFLDAFSNCLNNIDKISKKDHRKHTIKQIARLLNMFCIIQERLPIDLHKTLFLNLLQPTINCLTSSNYIKYFQDFKSNADSLTENQKLYLLKCPYFLTTYNGPHIEKAMEQVLDTMLPRYVTILDKHMKTIKQWKRPIMRAIHNLIITIVYAEGYFSSYTNTESFRSLINHLLNILNEPTLINKIHSNSNNIQTLLIDSTLVVFNVLVYESNALDYIKQCKPTEIFRKLTKTSYESIVLNAYMMLAYTIEDDQIRGSSNDLIKLLSTTFNLLRKTMTNQEQINNDRSILQLLETLKGLTQYEQIRNEIFKQDLVIFLIDSYEKCNGLSKQILLECLSKLSSNEQIAQQLRQHQPFIQSLENLPDSTMDNIPSNTLRRSASFSSRRNSISVISMEATNYGIQKVANEILWKVVKEPQLREKIEKQNETNISNDQRKYKFDIMISHSSNDKDIVKKIQRFLINQGYNIWYENIPNPGHGMKIVAEVIENSKLVIICMSDSYKRDHHCQAQAEYALITKRRLLPVIVHSGYKPDGWLHSLISKHDSIDFGTSNFKVASELLLKEIKQQQQQQHTKEISDVKQTASTLPNIVRSPSAPLAVFGKPPMSMESSALTETISSVVSSVFAPIVDRQQPTPTRPISRPSTPGANTSAKSVMFDKQQQSTARFTPRPPTPASIYIAAPITVFTPKQQQTPIQSASASSISDSIPSGTSIVDDKQQPITPEVASSSASTTGIQQQQQPLVQSVSLPLTHESITSIASNADDKKQQETTVHPIERSFTPSSISSDPSVTSGIQRQQTPVHSASESIIPDRNMPTTSTVIDRQQPQTATPDFNVSTASVVIDKQTTQDSGHSSVQPLPSALTSSMATMAVDKRQPQTTMSSILKPSTPNTVPYNTSVNIEKKQQEQYQQPTHAMARSLETNVMPSAAQQQSIHPVTGSLPNGIISSATPIAIDDGSQQQKSVRIVSRSPTLSSTSSNETDYGNKQQQQQIIQVHPIPPTKIVLPATSTVPVQYQYQTSVQSNIKTPIANPTPSAQFIIDDRQQRLTSVHSTPKSSVPTSADMEKQQRLPSRSDSTSTTPVTLPSGSSTHLGQRTSAQIYGREQLRLPEEYINRKTHNSIYRTLPIDAWRNNDVLDFLFDTNIHMMMPLCESMSGKALIQLFRMCQRESSRLYDQLNEELRIRFNGLTLPMGVYTQFLIEMDALVGPTPGALPSIPSSTPKVVERVILMPRTVQEKQLNSRPSTISSVSSDHSNIVTPVNTISGATTTHSTRIFERAIYRPSSNIGRPYNFIVESVEEPTVLLDQVQRYGNQLLLLDATAYQHREISSHR